MVVVPDKETYTKDPNLEYAGGIYHDYDQAYGEPIRINEADFLVVYSTSFGKLSICYSISLMIYNGLVLILVISFVYGYQ